MEAEINSIFLSDKPYQGEEDSVCSFNDTEVNAFVNEIIYGNPTCYLVSGYRGAGKTSFINRAKSIIEQKSFIENYKEQKRVEFKDLKRARSGSLLSESYDIVFVYTSFAKYNNQTAFLRQLVRNLYLAFESKPTKENPRINFLSKVARSKITKLNNRTFYDIKTQQEISTKQTSREELSVDLKISSLIKSFQGFVGPIVSLSIPSILLHFPNLPWWISILFFMASATWLIFSAYNIKASESSETSNEESTNTTEIYDDEIAFHYVEEILQILKSEAFKVVFILDELDKVADEEITKLINEMKPYLLSGLADFVVVAGQGLTHRYLSSSANDDDVITSLFSKSFHVCLKSEDELKGILKSKILKLPEGIDDKKTNSIDKFINHHLFISKRIPRILLSQIRQSVYWREGNSYIEISDDSLYERHHKIIEAINDVIKTTIEPFGRNSVVKDYLIFQLYRVAAEL